MLAPIIFGAAKPQIISNGFVLGRDLVRTPSNAFAANLAAVAGNEAKHFAMAFAAEAAVTVAHDANSEDWPMPQSE